MMRRARASLPLFALVLPLAVAACGGESIPPAPGPAHQTPAVTASPTPTPTATPSPTSVPAATPSPSPSPSPTPPPTATQAATPEPTPEPTPAPPPVEYTPITRVEARTLPPGVALYYRVTSCYACGHGFGDLRRIVFDDVSRFYRETRPLAFFDDIGVVNEASVSAGGQEIAVMICHVQPCGGEYSEYIPGPEAEQRLWISRDAGRQWEDLGPVLPGSEIEVVLDGDVLVEQENYWSDRQRWIDLDDEAWEALLEGLAALGLDSREGWERRSLWVVSGEEAPPASGPESPALGDLDWMSVGNTTEGFFLWAAQQGDTNLLAIATEQGAVQRVYGTAEFRWGPEPNGDPSRIPRFVTDDLLVRPSWTAPEPIQATAEIIELEAAVVHEVTGLTLPREVEVYPQEEYYHFWAARPVPAIPFTALTKGEPRELPAGTVLFFGDFPKEGYAMDVTRAIFDGETGAVVTDRPWGFFDGRGDVTSFQVSADGRTMAAAVCVQGQCEDCYSGPSEDALLHLWVSHSGGVTWEDWGEIPQGAYIAEVTAEDVAVTAWLAGDNARRWWFRTGEDFELPPELVPPRQATGLFSDDLYWYVDETRPDEAPLWTFYDEGERRHVLVGPDGEVLTAFFWAESTQHLYLTGFLTHDLLVGQLGSSSAMRSVAPPMPPMVVLVDLETSSVHPVEAVDEAEIAHCLCLWFSRPGG